MASHRFAARLGRTFREGQGVAAPALIAVWLAAGAGLIGMSMHMAIPGISAYSGSVVDVRTESGDGLRIFLRGSRFDFFFSDIEYSPLPDVRAGDEVQILAEEGGAGVDDLAGHPVISGLAVESLRGEWTDQIFGDEVAPFTPSWWPAHEAIRWLLLSLGLVMGGLGAASLLRWIPSRSSAGVGVESVPRTLNLATVTEASPSTRRLEEVAAAPSPATGSSPAATIGWLTLAVPGALDVVVIGIGGANACHPNNPVVGWGFIVLILVPIALAAGGITTLVMASRHAKSGGGSPSLARGLGVIALVLAVVALPVNFFAAMSWAFCF